MAYIGYIYRFRNAKNGKSYIGKTNNPKMRINSHRTHTPKVGCRFGKAIIKYGLDYFEFSILHTVTCQTIEDLNNKLNSLEIEEIKNHDSYYHVYNGTLGGDGARVDTTLHYNYGKHLSSSTKSKIAQARKIKIMQFTKDGVFVRDWDCAKDAQRTIGVDARHTGSCCRGNRKTAGGFVWKYKEGGEYAS